jgi:1-aminocyclopropane-1-carboxylate deaminase/D-cysteine desulfhydrase-like pyridoxal-dependent ACC family enzyme
VSPPIPQTGERALWQLLPRLGARVPFALLAELPTPVEPLPGIARALGSSAEIYQKRDDRTSSLYGGNKVRTLEVLFGDALAQGASHVYSTGAYGSNHAAASAMHAPRVGLTPGAILYPQPASPSAQENLALILSRRPEPPVRDLFHWSALPWGIWQQTRESRRRDERAIIMAPGGAVPLGALGYVSAGIELAHQVAAGELPRPRSVIVPTGSNCTTAGLLVGLTIAARLGIGLCDRGRPAPPVVVGVRVTPWPVSTRLRILSLAEGASHLLARLAGDERLACDRRELGASFELDKTQIGPGYGIATRAGQGAGALWRDVLDQPLETTYSGKAAAAVIARLRAGVPGPIVYWATKSSAPLPEVRSSEWAWAPRRMRDWLSRLPPAQPVAPSS